MTYEELVTRLTAAIDSTDPVADGNANESDEQQAEIILARLVAAHDHPGGAVTPVSDRAAYAGRLARWENNIDQTYVAFDRAIRALMVMVQERAVRYPDAETDARGNPIPVELRGEIYNATIRGWDPETPFPGTSDGRVSQRDHGLYRPHRTRRRHRRCCMRVRPGLRTCVRVSAQCPRAGSQALRSRQRWRPRLCGGLGCCDGVC